MISDDPQALLRGCTAQYVGNAHLVVIAEGVRLFVLERVLLERTLEDLGSNVVEGPKACVSDLELLVDGQAKVGELDVVVFPQQDVLRLEVSVDQTPGMDEGQRGE